MQSSVGQNAHPANPTKINLYHVDAGFFVRFMLAQIILRAQSEILPFFEVARRSRSSVSGRGARVYAAFNLNE